MDKGSAAWLEISSRVSMSIISCCACLLLILIFCVSSSSRAKYMEWIAPTASLGRNMRCFDYSKGYEQVILLAGRSNGNSDHAQQAEASRPQLVRRLFQRTWEQLLRPCCRELLVDLGPGFIPLILFSLVCSAQYETIDS